MKKLSMILFLLSALFCRPLAAEEKSVERHSIFLYEEVPLDFPPRAAYFFVKSPESELRRIPALLAPAREAKTANKSSADADKRGQLWGVGASLPLDDTSAISALSCGVYVVGPKGHSFFLPPHELAKKSVALAGLSSEELRQRLLEKKGVFKSWELQLEEQNKALQRLKADADVIAGLGRIVEVKEDIQRQNIALRDLEKDIANLEKFLGLVRDAPQPRNFAARESQLTKQIAELAGAAREAEASEHKRKSLSEQEMEGRLAVIEASRSENFDELQRRLIRLRKKRMELEGS